MRAVLPNQQYTIPVGGFCGRRETIRVDFVDENMMAHCTLLATGRATVQRCSVLSKGTRGIKLIMEASGRTVPADEAQRLCKTRVNPKMRAAVRLLLSGAPRDEVAREFNVSVKTIDTWQIRCRQEGVTS